MAVYQCVICQFLYDDDREGVNFWDRPSDWICPVCGAAKAEFVPVKDESA
jgi:pyruvate oxidase/acetolactate synthase-1/2/3 large subunit